MTNNVGHSSRGFTLIELLVILVIVGVVMSLMAPPLVKTIESSQARNEQFRLESRLKLYSSKAFINETNVFLDFNGSNLKIEMGKQTTTYQFEFISFPKQRLVYGPLGLPNISQLELLAGSQKRVLNLVKASHEK
ncbi:prepilin-type N-terminal cleavage/methylation domain-containing protein [Shewanella aestuarii]|uniref:Prepilin-type N-terminal cleavage/methylation domain-containing protein n=1 Tax=Shewanella aestuarii TaxID=1028752 RepID=A0A6G9QM70_9GAMM|nr:prepilin-type N-terminal cleavage/methylation domain-containing protein [Shewanella aestuarii]QIR15147.1 prepilin-type N-terminal cleavage/methylation domain-containing protein [Shewanella aestuarii]